MFWGKILHVMGHTTGSGPGLPVLVAAGLVLVGLTGVAAVAGLRTMRAAARRRQCAGSWMPGDPAREAIVCTALTPTLLTPGELRFFRTLRSLVTPRCIVFAKVRVADLFRVEDNPCGRAAAGLLRGKSIDFVLCDPSSTGLVAAIELDETAVGDPEREQRRRFVDDLFASNGLPLLRVAERAVGADPELLRAELARHDLLPARAMERAGV